MNPFSPALLFSVGEERRQHCLRVLPSPFATPPSPSQAPISKQGPSCLALEDAGCVGGSRLRRSSRLEFGCCRKRRCFARPPLPAVRNRGSNGNPCFPMPDTPLAKALCSCWGSGGVEWDPMLTAAAGVGEEAAFDAGRRTSFRILQAEKQQQPSDSRPGKWLSFVTKNPLLSGEKMEASAGQVSGEGEEILFGKARYCMG